MDKRSKVLFNCVMSEWLVEGLTVWRDGASVKVGNGTVRIRIGGNGMEGKKAQVTREGKIIGWRWETPYGWFADPAGSEIQCIPCETESDAIDVIRRLGTPQENHPQNWH